MKERGKMGNKVKVRWTTTITETYEAEMDLEDFVTMFDGDAPDLVQLQAGVNKDDYYIDAEELAGLEEADNMEFVGVNDRYVDSFELVKREENEQEHEDH